MKSSRCEAYQMPARAEAYFLEVKSKVSDMEKRMKRVYENHLVSHYGADTNMNSTGTGTNFCLE